VVRIDKAEIKIGVLALQGAFREHMRSLEKCGVYAEEIRRADRLCHMDGLIIPGGESTSMNKLILKYGFRTYLDDFHKEGKPIFGTCAGMILLAKEVKGHDFGLGLIDIEVERNCYGRQIESFEENVFIDLGNPETRFKAVFIRAPRITRASDEVMVLSRLGKDIILARQDNVLVSSFHPELEGDTRIHYYFIDMIVNPLMEEKRCQDTQSGIRLNIKKLKRTQKEGTCSASSPV
jgi:pyridoxal 5'-phosphate synthase pdxT subunit